MYKLYEVTIVFICPTQPPTTQITKVGLRPMLKKIHTYKHVLIPQRVDRGKLNNLLAKFLISLTYYYVIEVKFIADNKAILPNKPIFVSKYTDIIDKLLGHTAHAYHKTS